MMTSYFNLLKYAATGIASPDMTYYDRMRASTLMGGVVRTLTGQPPLTFKADGTPLTAWSIYGNGQQQGTPTPDNPVMPEFVGVRTGNLFDKTDILSGYEIVNNQIVPNSAWGVSGYIPVEQGKYYIATNTGSPVLEYEIIGGTSVRSGKSITTGVYTPSETARFIRINFQLAKLDTIMLNLGSTALPYEPFGWEEKITCAGQTVPVYLGQTQTVRRIDKFVLTGEEYWSSAVFSGHNGFLAYAPYSQRGAINCVCSHYKVAYENTNNTIYFVQNPQNGRFVIFDDRFSSATDFKAYLAAQYASGTPVCVWYVLATEQTGITNEPLCKIGTYADELSSTDAAVTIPTSKGQNTLTVDTPIQPSEMTITYKG